MPERSYRGRRAFSLENDRIRVTLLVEGGHVAEICDKRSDMNPLWTPPWPSIEPSTYRREAHPEYGADAESQLLSGIMGHNLCLDQFGGPSPEEAAAGMTVHGEASLLRYSIAESGGELMTSLEMPAARLHVERRVRLSGDVVHFRETVENLAPLDRPSAWTQHVTIGPPFLERGATQFRAPGTKSQTIEGEVFDWPMLHGADLRVYTAAQSSGGFTTHLMDPHREQAFFTAFSPRTKTLFGYVWRRADFPWLGIWEENHSRTAPPWNGRTMTRGLEFGASPIPEPRRKMIERNSLFGVPGYRWLPARRRVTVDYVAFVRPADRIPEEVVWEGERVLEA